MQDLTIDIRCIDLYAIFNSRRHDFQLMHGANQSHSGFATLLIFYCQKVLMEDLLLGQPVSFRI